MIINTASNAFSASVALPNNSSKSMSQDQMQSIENTLAKFDPDTITELEAIIIVEVFKESGIQPSQELTKIMSTYGFDAGEIGDLAGVNNSQLPTSQENQGGHPVTLNISTEMLEQLNVLLNEYYSENLSDDEQESTLNAIKDIFLETVPEGGLVNVYA